jgi:hypothetical protein
VRCVPSADALTEYTLLPWAATEAGRAHREAVERQTDRLALAPLEALGEEGCLRLRELARPMSVAIAGRLLPAVSHPRFTTRRMRLRPS